MTRSVLGKAYSASILIAALCVPSAAIAAPLIQFNFNTTILENMGPSPLNIGDDVSGALQIDSDDLAGSSIEDIDIFGDLVALQVDVFQGANTWGFANGPAWTQNPPGFAIGFTSINNYELPAGYMSDMPGYVTPAMFPNLPAAGDMIDAVLITVFNNDFFSSGTDKSFFIGLIFDAADNVVTGPGIFGVDADQLFTSLVYGEFWADATDSATDITIWEANGPIGASPVPVPAAVWLFGSGLLGLIGFTRKRFV